MARRRATVSAVVLAAAVVAAAVTIAAAASDAASPIDEAAAAGEPTAAIGPVPADEQETADDHAANPTVTGLTVSVDSDLHYGNENEEPISTSLDALSRGRDDDTRRRGKRRYSSPTCIFKVWEVLKAPAYHRPRWGSPRQVLLIRRIITARRIRGGRLGRRASRTKAWACTKRWVKVRGGGRRGGGRRMYWRPRYACRYVGTPRRMCTNRRLRRRFGALCGRGLRRISRTSPALRVQPEGGKRCDADPEPSPNV